MKGLPSKAFVIKVPAAKHAQPARIATAPRHGDAAKSPMFALAIRHLVPPRWKSHPTPKRAEVVIRPEFCSADRGTQKRERAIGAREIRRRGATQRDFLNRRQSDQTRREGPKAD